MFSAQGYDALRHGLACIRRTDRGVLRLTGADRATWLQGLVTNDVLALQPGHRVYSAYLTPQGRMIADLWVVADHGLLLDVPAPLAASLAERLDGLIFAEDVQVADVSAEMPCVHLLGPAARVAALPIPVLPGGGVLVPDHQYGVPGLVAYGPLDALLAENGLDDDLSSALEVDLETLNTVRIEAGVPRFLVDMTEETIPLEAGIEDRAISFTKGCYVGQEIIVRVTTRGGGRVARKLVGLRLDLPGGAGTEPPAAKASIHSGGRAIGHLTSATWSPAVSAHIALGYVHRDFVAPGSAVQVTMPAGPVPAVVAALPFVPPAV
jgi:folate-binding protein YgfZ